MTVQRKPFKTGGELLKDGNGNILKYTYKQALKIAKGFKTNSERRFTNGFKFKYFELIETENYFTYSCS